MEFWPEFLATSLGREFVAGGLGGMAGVVAGHPLDTLRIRLQQPSSPGARVSATGLLGRIVKAEGPAALYRGMAAPLGTIAVQNAIVFQVYAKLSKALSTNGHNDPPSYKSVAMAGFGTGALQSLTLSPIELVKIRLQLQLQNGGGNGIRHGPMGMAKKILQREGLQGIYRGLSITILRDAPAHALYFSTYEYTREKLHPGCRKSGQESLLTMLLAGGMAGVASWVICYPPDVIKSRLQGQSLLSQHGERLSSPKYRGILDCLHTSVREEGYQVLWRGLGAAISRAFVVNGAIFSAYELALRFMPEGNSYIRIAADDAQLSEGCSK